MDELGRIDAEMNKSVEKFPIYIILDDVRSMNNVGSVFRTGDALGVAGIKLCGFTPQPPHRDIHKTALGATETVKWEYAATVVDAIKELKKLGYKIVAIEQTHNSTWLQDFQIVEQEKIAIIMGNEVVGVSDDALALCDAVIEVPQFGSKHSLNISVTTGVVLWDLVRRYLNK